MELHSLLTELIAIDSTSSLSNVPMVECIEQYFESSDVACYSQETHEKGKFNLLLIKGEPSEVGLTLCGHMDTVPANPRKWQTNPWELSEQEGNWVARGSCDMKGFVAIALCALKKAQIFRGCLAVLLLCDEEIGSFGARFILEDSLPVPIPKQVIIGEPTSLRVVRLHKGHLSLQLSIQGVSAHTGFPHLGKNAAIAGASVITGLSNLSDVYKTKQTQASKHFPAVASFPVLTVATVKSGSAINVVPESCEIGIGLRLLPDQNQEEAITEIKSVIEESCPLPWELTILGNNPVMLTDKDADINRWLCQYIEQVESIGVSFGTDGGYLSRAGYECVLYGAGDIAVAHKPDEYVPIIEMQECANTIDAAIQHFCGEEK